ncbi:DUF2089 family protein [Myroides sp. LJL119]
MSTNHKLPILCPSCKNSLQVTELSCQNCHTQVKGKYALPLFLKLPEEDQNFLMDFFLHSGSLKQMAKQMNISYPTVRNKLDDLINQINSLK